MANEKKVLRDYSTHMQKKTVKVERAEKPLMNILVFLCSLFALVSMLFPMVRAYVWSSELGLPPQQGIVYSVNLFDTLNMVFNGGESMDIGSVDDIKNDLNSNNIWNLIVGENTGEFNAAIDCVIVASIAGILVVLLGLAVLFLSMLGIVGAKKTEPIMKWLSLALLVVGVVYAVFCVMIYADATPLNVLNLRILSSFGGYLVAAFCLGTAVLPWCVKK